MYATKEERNSILQMIETGQVSAREAAQLLDTLEHEQDEGRSPSQRAQDRGRERIIRMRLTNITSRRQHVYMTATLPVTILRSGLRLGTHLLPALQSEAAEDLLTAIERGASGRLLDVQDLDRGERLEIFVD